MIFYYILRKGVIIENPNKGQVPIHKNSFASLHHHDLLQIWQKLRRLTPVMLPSRPLMDWSTAVQSQLEASLIKHLPLVNYSDEYYLFSFALPNSMTRCLGLVLTNGRKGKNNNIRIRGGQAFKILIYIYKAAMRSTQHQKVNFRWNYCLIIQTRCQQILVTYF